MISEPALWNRNIASLTPVLIPAQSVEAWRESWESQTLKRDTVDVMAEPGAAAELSRSATTRTEHVNARRVIETP